MSNELTRVALVTGTSSGIGEAVAAELLRKSWRVIGAARRPAAIEHPQYTHLHIDLANVGELANRMDAEVESRLADQSISRFGLVNCAADPGLLGTVDHIDPVQMLRVSAINFVAPSMLMGWIVRRSSCGVPVRIVNVSSGAAANAFPGLGTYSSTKAALRMAGMVFASELDARTTNRRDATILSYEPGIVDTPMQTTIRATTIETVPVIDMFKRFATDGLLVPPSGPAAEIAAYLDSDGHARFTERRYGVA